MAESSPALHIPDEAQESTEIVQSGRCRCTEDETCWEHEALEMHAEHALRLQAARADELTGGGE